MKFTWIIVALTALTLTNACAAAEPPAPAAAQGTNCDCAAADWKIPYVPIAEFDDLKEPSGIVYHPQFDALFVAGDKGHLTQLGLNGQNIRQEKLLDGASFEGITLNPATGLLYLALESHDRVYEVDPAEFLILRVIDLDRTFEGSQLINPGNNGLEGITFVPGDDGGSFYFTNQSDELGGPDPSIVFEGKIDESGDEPIVKIVRYFSPGVTDLSGIFYNADTQELWVISDDNNLLLSMNLNGEITQAFALPGYTQEGITLDNNGALYIAQDDGDVIKYQPVQR
jgi:uncharacterized protein YjiK